MRIALLGVSHWHLPLYLPGNGALLLAMTAMRNAPGWYIETEGIMEYPF